MYRSLIGQCVHYAHVKQLFRISKPNLLAKLSTRPNDNTIDLVRQEQQRIIEKVRFT